MKIGMELFMRIHRFRQLKIAQKLNTLPNNGHIVLGVLLTNEKKHGTNAITATELAKYMSVSTPAISRTIKNLREAGFINTEPDPKDRRGAIISITELGRNTLIDDCNRLEDLMKKASQNISDEEIEQFFKTFDKLYSGIICELEKDSLPEK